MRVNNQPVYLSNGLIAQFRKPDAGQVHPGRTHSGLTTLVKEFVVVAIMSASRTASSGLSTGRTSAVTFCCISLTKASRLLFVGL